MSRRDGTNCDHCGRREVICAAFFRDVGTPCCGECGHGRAWPADPVDPRIGAVRAFVWNASNWPAELQRHILGRPVPFDFALAILAAADAADPLRMTARVDLERGE